MLDSLLWVCMFLGGVGGAIDLYVNDQLELSFKVVPLTAASFETATPYSLLLPPTLSQNQTKFNQTTAEAILVVEMITFLPQLVPYLTTKALLTSYRGSESLSPAVMYNHQILPLPLPIGIISYSDQLRIASLMSLPNTTITFIFHSYDQNDWLHFTQAGGRTVLCSILILSALLCLSFALHFLRHKMELSLGSLCLSLEVAFNLTRLGGLFLNAVDMLFTTNNYLIYVGLYLVSFPFMLGSGILLIFFWIDVTSQSLYKGSFLDKLLKPTLCFLTITFVMCWSVAVCCFLRVPSNEASLGIMIALSVLILVVAFIYFYTTHRVYRFAQGLLDKDRKVSILNMLWKIMTCGVIMVVLVVNSLLMEVTTSLGLYYVCFFLMDMLLSVQSAIQISFMRKRKKKNSSKSELQSAQ